MNRCYAPTQLSNKKLQKEILCDIQLSSLIFLVSYRTNFEKMNIAIPSFYIIYHFLTFFILLTFKVGDLNYRSFFILSVVIFYVDTHDMYLVSPPEKFPYSKFFCSVFSRIRTEYGPE